MMIIAMMLVLKTIVNIYAVISKPDKPSLIEAIRALAGLEGVEGGEHDQQEGEEEAGHEPALIIMMLRRWRIGEGVTMMSNHLISYW